MLQGLLDKIIDISGTESQSPTFLSLIGQESREMTHSAFIASLLDPNGVHNQGTLFLDEFIAQYGYLQLSGLDAGTTIVEVEKYMGPEVDDETPKGGRIDIYLEDAKGVKVVIENKIHASDQDKQLERYWNSINQQGVLIYLTLEGHKPTPKSLGKLLQSNVNNISYKDDIINWLKACINKIDNSELCVLLGQYIKTIKMMTNEYEIVKVITENASNMKSALAISSSIDKARSFITERFMQQLHDRFQEDDNAIYDVRLAKELYKDNEGWHFHLDVKDFKLDVCVNWRLFVRVIGIKDQYVDNAFKIQLCKTVLTAHRDWNECDGKDNIAWRYVRINGSLVDFHSFDGSALDYLDHKATIVEAAHQEILKICTSELKFS